MIKAFIKFSEKKNLDGIVKSEILCRFVIPDLIGDL